MKKRFYLKYSVLGVFALYLVGCQSDSIEENSTAIENITFKQSQVIPGSYIIELNDDMNSKLPTLSKVNSKAEFKSQQLSLRAFYLNEFKSIDLNSNAIKNVYGHALNGFAAQLSEAQVNALRNDKRIKSVEEDLTISISPYKGKPGGGGGGNDPEEVPYGTTRVGGGGATSSHVAWVIDSGIDQDHPDLNVDTSNSISFLSGSPSNQSPNDQNGHGTHVAGTIGAIDNEIGTVGVSPGNLVVAVRVLDRRGSGSTSGVIAGVNYVAANGSNGDVANMSLGGGVSTSLDNAVINASANVTFVLAAGNESDDANNHSPARANGPNIYTISAMNSSDNWASFSNYGDSVDYCAPGVAVKSAWKNGGYNTISGTSMAAPHAAGVLLFGNPSSDGTVNGDPDGDPDPIIHL
ncbi:MAG: S8 family peptidase [Bacteroidia bacterium]|nr:S8 family peptidase [Bacteroidia bacterium]MBT8279654.1 S8 family peptidase [Bacteroidia bacterium]NND25354.1 S8 family peptidase [Flavobacteriaceae bacterium]NNK60299.1 S8 family peptidase [Flavobacteriaceae bacterium]NNL32418.1 S8 family peptidase [Flavobacteriaceae bacterium]